MDRLGVRSIVGVWPYSVGFRVEVWAHESLQVKISELFLVLVY